MKRLSQVWKMPTGNFQMEIYIKGKAKDGRKNGHAMEVLGNGEYYEGEFRDGLRHGYGKCTKADGST
jgi:MORN repeat